MVRIYGLYVKKIRNPLSQNIPWSKAEPNFYKQAIIRNKQLFNWQQLNFVDILDIFKDEPISIKGVLNYGLKDVSKGLHKLGLIKTGKRIWMVG